MQRFDVYDPKLIEGVYQYSPVHARGLIAVYLQKCHTCGRWMVDKDLAKSRGLVIPLGEKLADVVARVDWRIGSGLEDADGEEICNQCASENKAAFVCALCGETRASGLEQERIGDPPDILCKVCYETQPAKVWVEKVAKLWEEHRYDFK